MRWSHPTASSEAGPLRGPARRLRAQTASSSPGLSPRLPRGGPFPPGQAHGPIAALPAARTRRLGPGWAGLPLSPSAATPSAHAARGRQEEFARRKLGASSGSRAEERKLEARRAKPRKPSTTHKTSVKDKPWERKQNPRPGLP